MGKVVSYLARSAGGYAAGSCSAGGMHEQPLGKEEGNFDYNS